jgi:alginate O-acetyltransferase complex protein AlgI
MIFSSPAFILVFLPLAFIGYFFLNRRRLVIAGKVWLVLMSLVFYGYWSVAYVPLLVSSIIFNFLVGTKLIPGTDTLVLGWPRRTLLIGGIVANLALLGYFKYANFLVDNINTAFDAHYVLGQITLPLGISFFTFTQIAYLVDSYQGEAKEYDFINYALFVTFFPHLIAGPILHHQEMMTQFESRWTWVVRHRNIVLGLFIFSIGLFKKVIVADTFAIWANRGFDSAAKLDFVSAWATSLSYTLQLYFDFSGYCDMAIGAALLFNIWLPLNFNSPYKALDIQDFWRRWHMTLSRYLRDYLYIPLGGNRCSEARVNFNLMATFMLGGLWHGASWMFVIWGTLHGCALVIHRAWHAHGYELPRVAAWLITFGFVNVTWVFFRAKTLDDAIRVLGGMVDLNSLGRLAVESIPTASLAWGGVFSDRLLSSLPAGLVANLLCVASIALVMATLGRRNSFELLTAARARLDSTLRRTVALFLVALYATVTTKSPVFLYYNF